LAFDPSTLTTLDIALILLAVFSGGFVKGCVGLGLPLIAIPVMSAIVDPRISVAILAPSMIVSNIMQARTGGHVLDTAFQFRWLLIPMVVCSGIGVMLITSAPIDLAKGIVGIIVILFALLTLSGKQPTVPKGADKFVRPLMGGLAGLIGGMTSFFGPPVIPYLMSLGLEKARFVQLMGMAFLLGSIPLLTGMILKGFAPPKVLIISGGAVASVFLGMYVGGLVRDHIPQAAFMKLVSLFLLIIGGKMLWAFVA